MFFVNSGVIIIEVGGKQVASLREGSYFGELGLMFADGRKACAKAKKHCTLLELRQADFFELIKKHPDFAAVLYENMSEQVYGM
jgi:CPA1 family monovalent cation:H+ antiporter